MSSSSSYNSLWRSRRWRFSNDEFEKTVSSFLPFFEENLVTESVTVEDCHYQPMLSRLLMVSFPNLEQLVLTNCDIESVENLHQLYAPKLKTLSLEGNRIANYSPLRKFDGKELENFFVPSLNVYEIEGMFQMNSLKMNAKKCERVQVFQRFKKRRRIDIRMRMPWLVNYIKFRGLPLN